MVLITQITQQHELIMMGITAAVFAAIGWVAGRIFQRWRDVNEVNENHFIETRSRPANPGSDEQEKEQPSSKTGT